MASPPPLMSSALPPIHHLLCHNSLRTLIIILRTLIIILRTLIIILRTLIIILCTLIIILRTLIIILHTLIIILHTLVIILRVVSLSPHFICIPHSHLRCSALCSHEALLYQSSSSAIIPSSPPVHSSPPIRYFHVLYPFDLVSLYSTDDALHLSFTCHSLVIPSSLLCICTPCSTCSRAPLHYSSAALFLFGLYFVIAQHKFLIEITLSVVYKDYVHLVVSLV